MNGKGKEEDKWMVRMIHWQSLIFREKMPQMNVSEKKNNCILQEEF